MPVSVLAMEARGAAGVALTGEAAVQSSSRSTLSGLQDLKGQWSGSAQAYGGGGGATNVDFNVRGQSWQWGDYALDQASAPRPCSAFPRWFAICHQRYSLPSFCMSAAQYGLFVCEHTQLQKWRCTANS